MSVLSGGSAIAIGTNTSVAGLISNTIEHTPYATIATGDVLFQAVANSPSCGAKAAQTNAFVNITGADFIFEVKINETGHNGNAAWSSTEIQYVAIDFPNWSPPGGRAITELLNININASGHQGSSAPAQLPSGNVASILAMAEAYGPNTLAQTHTQALTAENHFSLVTGSTFAIA